MDKELKSKYIKLGSNVAYYRRLAGKSQEQVADDIDVSYTHISKIETATSAASLDVIFKVAQAIGVPVCKLFEFKE